MQTTRNMLDAALSKAVASATKTIQIRDAFPVGDRFARMVAVAAGGTTPQQIKQSISANCKNGTAIAGSFLARARDASKVAFEGIVAIVSERIVLSDANRSQYKAVASNLFMDDNENMWALKDTATGQILVKSIAADDYAVMQQLMAVASTDHNDFGMRNIGHDNAVARASIEGGDLISYVSEQSGRVEMGIACAAIVNADGTDTFQMQVVRPDGETETVNREMVVAAAEHEVPEDPEDQQIMATASSVNLDMIAKYYARVFARRPAYYEEFMRRFRAHAFF